MRTTSKHCDRRDDKRCSDKCARNRTGSNLATVVTLN